MPSRSTTSLGGGSRIPLRGFTQLLKHLDPGVRTQLENAFVEAENMVDYHSRTVPERQTKRRFSGTIQQPILTIQSTIIGAFVKWERLTDKRIAFYEVQVADDNTFSNPETYHSIETFFSLESVVTTKFVRLRGVRTDGDAGTWSETGKIRPTITAPAAMSVEFYPGYALDEFPTIGQKNYSGGKRYRDSSFYTILEETFYADRISGGFSVWGYVSNRLAKMADANAVPWDRVRFKVNGIAVQDGYFPIWTNMMDEDANLNANKNDVDPSGNVMSFYAQGGYTASFGPYNINIPNSLAGQGPFDAGRILNLDSAKDESGRFYWSDPNNAKHPSRWDQGQFSSPSRVSGGLSGASDPGAPIDSQHEASSQNLTEDQKTEYLWFHNFKFDIPVERQISGIRVEASRRQPNIVSQVVIQDLGNAAVNRPLTASENADGDEDNDPGGYTDWETSDIITDVDYGDYLPINDRFDKFVTTLPQLANEAMGILDANEFTVATWVNFSSATPTTNPSMACFKGKKTVGLGQGNEFWMRRGTGVNFQDNCLINMWDDSGTTRFFNADGVFNNLDQWYFIAVRKDNTGSVALFVDGQPHAWFSESGGVLSDFADTDGDFSVCGAIAVSGGSSHGGVSQTGFWSTALSNGDIERLYNLRMMGDWRFASGGNSLRHYYLAFPDQGDTQDNAVYLTDRNPTTGGVRVRSDLNNKAVTDESWPQLSEFWQTGVRQYNYLPLGDSDGIPHDNHNAIGYQDYGGEGDLWGASSWSPATVNDFYFGFVIQAINNPTQAVNSHAYVDHGQVTVYHIPEEDRSFTAGIEVAVANQFYLERETFGAVLNFIEMGEKIAVDYVRCQTDA